MFYHKLIKYKLILTINLGQVRPEKKVKSGSEERDHSRHCNTKTRAQETSITLFLCDLNIAPNVSFNYNYLISNILSVERKILSIIKLYSKIFLITQTIIMF